MKKTGIIILLIIVVIIVVTTVYAIQEAGTQKTMESGASGWLKPSESFTDKSTNVAGGNISAVDSEDRGLWNLMGSDRQERDPS